MTPPAPQSVNVVMAPNMAHVIPLKPTPLPSSRTETPFRGVVCCRAGRNENFLQVSTAIAFPVNMYSAGLDDDDAFYLFLETTNSHRHIPIG